MIVPNVPVDSVIEPDSATKYAVAPAVLVGMLTSPTKPGRIVAPNSEVTDFALRTSTKFSGNC